MWSRGCNACLVASRQTVVLVSFTVHCGITLHASCHTLLVIWSTCPPGEENYSCLCQSMAFGRPYGSIWVPHGAPDPQLHDTPLICNIYIYISCNDTTFKCYIAFRSIPASCHMPPSILFTIYLVFNTWCLIIWFVLDAHWSPTD